MYLNSILCVLLFALIINATCGVFTDFELDEADRFSNDQNVSCEVTGENRNPDPDEKENPTYCWAFYKNKTYGSVRNLNCCKTVEIPNVDKPDQTLKDIVRVEPDGIHIFYGKFLQNAKDERMGLLIPMLTFSEKELHFRINFSKQCVEFDQKSNGKPTSLDYMPRIAANIIHFSYKRGPNNTHWKYLHNEYRAGYAAKCGTCDEYIYLPYPLEGEYSPLFIKLTHSNEVNYTWSGSNTSLSGYFQQKGQEAGAGKLLTNIQQWQNVCPLDLSKWDGGFDGKDAFYLPFRLLYPAFSTYHDGPSGQDFPIMIKDKGDCDYELFFDKENYRLLAPQEQHKAGSVAVVEADTPGFGVPSPNRDSRE